MKRRVILGVLLLFIVIALAMYPAGKDDPSNSNYDKGANFTIYNQNMVRVAQPIVYYKLKNRSVIHVRDKNPFPFSIRTTGNAEMAIPHALQVYRVKPYKEPGEIYQIASTLGITTSKIYYNNVTGAYLYHNDSISFEYETRTGFLRLEFKKPVVVDGEKNISKVALKILKEKGLLYKEPHNVKVVNNTEINGNTLTKAVIVQPEFNGIAVENFGLAVVFRGDNLVSVEGIVPKTIIPLGTHPIKTIPQALQELEAKIKSGTPMTDWYINWLAFTEMRIDEIALRYRLSPEGYIVPVYVFHGRYMLDYEGLKDEGNITALLVAVSG